MKKSDKGLDLRIHSYCELHGVRQTAEHFKITIDQVKTANRRVKQKREIIKQAFDYKTFQKFKFYCHKIAHKNNLSSEVDEFTSWAIIKRLEGRAASIEMLAIDYQRELFGKASKDKPASKRKETIDALRFTQDINEINVKAPDYQMKDSTIEAIASILKLDLKPRVMFILFFKHDLSYEDIGACLEISGSRISQIMNEILQKIINHVESKELLLN